MQLRNCGQNKYNCENKMSSLESQSTIIINGDVHINSQNKPLSNHDETLEEPKTKGSKDQQSSALELKYIIIDMAPVTFIDSSGSKMLERVSTYVHTHTYMYIYTYSAYIYAYNVIYVATT